MSRGMEEMHSRDGQGGHCSSDSKLGLLTQMKSGDLSSSSCPGCVHQPVASLCRSPRAHGRSHYLPRGAAVGRTGLSVLRAQKCLACGRCPLRVSCHCWSLMFAVGPLLS